jgi:hypothetical protein
VLLKSPYPGNSLVGAAGHHVRVAGGGNSAFISPAVYSAFIHPCRADWPAKEFATECVTFTLGLF